MGRCRAMVPAAGSADAVAGGRVRAGGWGGLPVRKVGFYLAFESVV